MADQTPPYDALAALLAADANRSRLPSHNALSPAVSTLLGLGAIPPATSASTLLGLAAIAGSAPSPSYNALFPGEATGSGLLNAAPTSPAGALGLLGSNQPIPGWAYVRRRFNSFLGNMQLTPTQMSDNRTQQGGVITCLNRHYYGHSSETLNGTLIGSWGKDTRVRPPRDADIMFMLPVEVYYRFQTRAGNRQSQLLQEVKGVLAATYSRTEMRGDGQVVIVPFTTPIEVVPAFACQDGSTIVCDANLGGRYITSTSAAEIENLNRWDMFYHGNVRNLIRMAKQWQRHTSVPLKSFILERLAVEFSQSWPYSHRDVFWYDWMARDFFAYLLGRAGGQIVMPETNDIIPLGTDWLSRAQSAHARAIKACDYEHQNNQGLAGDEWQKIFGAAIPMWVE